MLRMFSFTLEIGAASAAAEKNHGNSSGTVRATCSPNILSTINPGRARQLIYYTSIIPSMPSRPACMPAQGLHWASHHSLSRTAAAFATMLFCLLLSTRRAALTPGEAIRSNTKSFTWRTVSATTKIHPSVAVREMPGPHLQPAPQQGGTTHSSGELRLVPWAHGPLRCCWPQNGGEPACLR